MTQRTIRAVARFCLELAIPLSVMILIWIALYIRAGLLG